jgi:Tfp pilus assembly protein PilF
VLALSLAITLVTYSQTERDKQEEIHSRLQKAQEALKSENAPPAEQELRAVLALDPNNSDARAKLGFVLFLRGDWVGAAEDFEQVLKVQPHLANAQVVLGMCKRRLGRPAEARKLLGEALPHLPAGALQTQAGLELAEILYQSGDLEQAVMWFGSCSPPIPGMWTCSIPPPGSTLTLPIDPATHWHSPRPIRAGCISSWRSS